MISQKNDGAGWKNAKEFLEIFIDKIIEQRNEKLPVCRHEEYEITEARKMKKIREMSACLIVITFAFYVSPFFIKDTGSGILFLLIFNPIICFLTSLIYGIKHSFHLIYSLLIMALFIPAIFIFYNESAAIYVFIYGIIAIIGNFLGSLLKIQ